VGKSTLVNALVGHERQATGEVRGGDQKGRHTTTAAELVALPGTGILVDTPGVRALALWNADEGVAAAFPEIAEAAANCRFDDCSHRRAPGCAVLELVAEGVIDPARHRHWCELVDELAALD
jgi:ribosome biogenesis GTPase